MTENVTELNESEFQNAVVEESRKRPVLVDFWAPWCGPCRSLTPILEKLADEYAGQFLLAKINSDENQALAGELGVRGIPNVKAFYGGQMVDEFTGAMPEGMVRQFLERVLPSEAEKRRQAAMKAYESGEAEQALAGLDTAQLLEPDNDIIRMDRAEILLKLGRAAEADRLLNELSPLAAMEPRAEHLKAELTFADGEEATDVGKLEARVSNDPQDLTARLALAKHYANQKLFERALQQLLEIVRTDRTFGDDVGRKTMLALFELLGNDHELASQYRRLLAASLN
ncbi:MAG: co-chaperone YbbN [Betaproteobacteria bacterium]|jgi:putative thioredoxin|nr:MAG: co-chaperone YbbN [Betaproteobacteria bacterium]